MLLLIHGLESHGLRCQISFMRHVHQKLASSALRWFLFMLSLAAVSGGYSLVVVLWLLLLRITGSTAWAWGVGAHRLSCLRHVESSQTTDRIRVPCIGMQILNHWTTREALCIVFTLGTRLVKPLLFWMLPIATAEGKVIWWLPKPPESDIHHFQSRFID